jgi:hypothetical protein
MSDVGVIEITETKQNVGVDKGWQVVLYNDDVNEFGHVVEMRDPLIMKFNNAFLEKRTEHDVPVQLSSIYPKLSYEIDEVAKADRFFNAYVGKEMGSAMTCCSLPKFDTYNNFFTSN